MVLLAIPLVPAAMAGFCAVRNRPSAGRCVADPLPPALSCLQRAEFRNGLSAAKSITIAQAARFVKEIGG